MEALAERNATIHARQLALHGETLRRSQPARHGVGLRNIEIDALAGVAVPGVGEEQGTVRGCSDAGAELDCLLPWPAGQECHGMFSGPNQADAGRIFSEL